MDQEPIEQYFCEKNEHVPENYISFRTIYMTIGNGDEMPYEKIYFKFMNNSGYTYSNIGIFGKTNNETPKHLATFFKRADISFGLMEIFKNEEYLTKMKLKVLMLNRINSDQWNMEVNIFIDKTFLLSLYEQGKLPKFLFKIIQENCEDYRKQKYSYKNIEPPQDIYVNNHIVQNYKRELYTYQKNNVNWMIEMENNIKNNKGILTYELPENYYVYNIPNINEQLICDNKCKIVNLDEIENTEILFNGGVLSDDIGLGKTFQMLSLITEQLNKEENNTTLLICPSRLCKQWIEEINKTYDLKYKLIGNIRQFKKITPEIYKENDLIIISYNFLNNKNYIKYCEENPLNETLFHNYLWNRVVLDEGHEIINNLKKKAILEIREVLFNIKSKYRWICSGTPFNNAQSFVSLLKYITTIEFNSKYRHIYNDIIKALFRKNTKESVKEEVSIPEPIITTEFLNLSALERTIYDSALGNKDKQIEFCNHIMVSDDFDSILGNKPLSLDEIHNKMTEFYQTKTDTLDKRINKNKEEIDKLHNRINEIEYKLENETLTQVEIQNQVNKKIKKQKLLNTEIEKLENNKGEYESVKAKLNIFNNINEKLEEEETCPICLEELDDLTKTITPCGHIYCAGCIGNMKNVAHNTQMKCAMCRNKFKLDDLVVIKSNTIDKDNKPVLGTKIEYLMKTLKDILNENENEKIIVFSQWDNMLKLISKILNEHNFNHIFINGSLHIVSSKIRKFKLDSNINIVLMSSDKSPSGLNLTEASTIILLDSLNTTKDNAKIIEEQAIGRAVRIGQTKQVNVKRFIMRNTIEHDFYVRNIEE